MSLALQGRGMGRGVVICHLKLVIPNLVWFPGKAGGVGSRIIEGRTYENRFP